jgi:hypothetical protein
MDRTNSPYSRQTAANNMRLDVVKEFYTPRIYKQLLAVINSVKPAHDSNGYDDIPATIHNRNRACCEFMQSLLDVWVYRNPATKAKERAVHEDFWLGEREIYGCRAELVSVLTMRPLRQPKPWGI